MALSSVFYYPGWVRKSITFTIDDGNVPLDAKFIAITKPAGIRGTFNLRTPLIHLPDAEAYRKFYEGYEIANHCRYHAYPFTDDRHVVIRDEYFNADTADKAFGYRTDEEGLYRIYTYDWTYLADDDKYMALVADCQEELERIFGNVKGYVWPCGEQRNEKVFERLRKAGFQSIRKTGCVKDATGFSLPADRMRWSYNANNTCLCETAALYEAYPDDGELKFFCFGVHSHDFENAGNWDVLEEFCRLYGNRPQDFWYATVGEIFDYEDAVRQVYEENGRLVNPTGIPVYALWKGERVVL